MFLLRISISYRIGKMYNMGYGTEKSYTEAANWYIKAENNKFAQYSLASLYFYGNGVDQDYIEALRLYESSAKQGNAYAMYETARMYHFGKEINMATANSWYKQAFNAFMKIEADNADDKLWYRIGQMLEKGLGTEINMEKAKEFYIKSADAGNKNSQYALAKIYLDDPDSTQEQIQTAISYLEKLTEDDNDLAQYKLGKLYLDGNQHIPKDIEKAIYFYTLSADNGNQYAQYQLGKIYLFGNGVEKDQEKALFYLTKSAEQGNEYAKALLDYKPNNTSKPFSQSIITLLHHLSRTIENDCININRKHIRADSKEMKKIMQKKSKLGQKFD